MPASTTRVLARDVPRLLAPPPMTTWAGCFAGLTSSRVAVQSLSELTYEYRRDGGFERPVLWHVAAETGVPTILSGVSRVIVASSANGHVDLHRGWLPDEPEDEQFVRLTFDVEVPSSLISDADLDEVDAVLFLVSSFRIPSGRWVNCDTTAWEYLSRFEGSWHCPHRFADELASSVEARLQAAGVRTALVDMELYEIW